MDKKNIPFGALVLALVCFLLPFVELSCGGQKVAMNGFESAIGKKVGGGSDDKVPASLSVVVALLAIGGAAFFAQSEALRREVSILSGVATASLLFFKVRFAADIAAKTNGGVLVEFGIGYWGATLLSAVAAFVAFNLASEKPKTTDVAPLPVPPPPPQPPDPPPYQVP